ncbi:hypothetical protein C8Q75DRAFT_457907 [Abortiporus biennis]|nr:hypothetical protein C8Q75DRAFT_457907 [Abortiporus biennis]
MKFQRLVQQLFKHRRSKSDTQLALRHTTPQSSLPKHSVSASCLDLNLLSLPTEHDTVHSSQLFSDVLASIPLQPISLPSKSHPPGPSSQPQIEHHRPSSFPKARSELPYRGIPKTLSSIQELESQIQHQAIQLERIPLLEGSLRLSRHALQEANSQIALLTSDVTALQADLISARGELFHALNDKISLEHTLQQRIQTLELENKKLRDSLSMIFSLGTLSFDVPPGSSSLESLKNLSQPGSSVNILPQFSQRILESPDPQEALIFSIKQELLDPHSPWRILLEPIIGHRSPEDYVAQVNCTLRARREVRDWRKRAKFWKVNARQDGRHLNTVTPSVSELSDVGGDELPLERKIVVEEMMVRLREGTLPLIVNPRRGNVETTDASEGEQFNQTYTYEEPSPAGRQSSLSVHSLAQPSTPQIEVLGSQQPQIPTQLSPIAELTTEFEFSLIASTSFPSLPPLNLLDFADISMTQGDDQMPVPALEFLPSSSSSPSKHHISPATSTISTATSPPYHYANLPPLASITFRETHSIRHSPSRGSSSSRRRESASMISLTSLRAITPSASTSTQNSRTSQKSLRRRMKVHVGTALCEEDKGSGKGDGCGVGGEGEDLNARIIEVTEEGDLVLVELVPISASKPEEPRESSIDLPRTNIQSLVSEEGDPKQGSDIFPTETSDEDTTPRASLLSPPATFSYATPPKPLIPASTRPNTPPPPQIPSPSKASSPTLSPTSPTTPRLTRIPSRSKVRSPTTPTIGTSTTPYSPQTPTPKVKSKFNYAALSFSPRSPTITSPTLSPLAIGRKPQHQFGSMAAAASSKLPVFNRPSAAATVSMMRRLSLTSTKKAISKPVLVDTTNAGVKLVGEEQDKGRDNGTIQSQVERGRASVKKSKEKELERGNIGLGLKRPGLSPSKREKENVTSKMGRRASMMRGPRDASMSPTKSKGKGKAKESMTMISRLRPVNERREM